MVTRLMRSGETLGKRFMSVNARLRNSDPECGLVRRIDAHLQAWRTLASDGNELHGFEAFLFEIGSAARFATEIKALNETPERLNQIMGELKRFSHLLGDHNLAFGRHLGRGYGLHLAPPCPELDVLLVRQ